MPCSGFANSQDSAGDYVFGGYRSNSLPFSGSLAAGVQYQGDQGAHVADLRLAGAPITTSGDDIFNAIHASPARALRFVERSQHRLGAGVGPVAGGQLQRPRLRGERRFRSGLFGGRCHHRRHHCPSLDERYRHHPRLLAASPSASTARRRGDSFNVSTVASAFDVLGNFVTSLSRQRVGHRLRQQAGHRQHGCDPGQHLAGPVRRRLADGRSGNQQNIGSDLDLQYSQALSRLEDVDYAEAVSNLTQQKTFPEAAQRASRRSATCRCSTICS